MSCLFNVEHEIIVVPKTRTKCSQNLKSSPKKSTGTQTGGFFRSRSQFKGSGAPPVFIVGDQPSTSEWGPEHPHRIVFYKTLESVGLANAHLTDLYKKRGLSGSLKSGLPADFSLHLDLFREEIKILRPKIIIALGELAQGLLKQNLREWDQPIPRIWHFSHVVKAGKQSEYAANLRKMIIMDHST